MAGNLQLRILGIFALVLGVTASLLTHAADPAAKHIVMIAGNPSHGYGSHEHYAGQKILAETLENSGLPVTVTIVRGWPEDPAVLQSADSIVIYSDGGGGHLALPHRDELKELLSKGTGFVCLHYATEVPKGPEGDDWLSMLGGNFEVNWSVNPHWTANFKTLPEHEVTRGVQPFAANDEWYFHIRFPESPAKVTPILQAVAPEDTMRRPDGAHEGNPAVRKSVAAGELQTVAWTLDRPDGGRSFGFTGGHFHWNWGNEDILRLVSNAIAWTAHVDVPKEGVSLEKPNMDRLFEDQDFDRPADFNAESVAEEFHLSAVVVPQAANGASESKLLFTTPLMSTATSGHRTDIDIDLQGARDIYLVVTDGGNGHSCDWADWIDPILYGNGNEKSLVSLDWVSATSGYGAVQKNKNCGGNPISVRNESITAPALGMHANGMIHYRIPEGFTHLRTTAALDSEGTNQNGGNDTSVLFAIYAGAAPKIDSPESNGTGGRDPADAVAGLDVAQDVTMTLAASEPELRSLTNLDIDDRGRVWVCDVMNYRGNQGSRPEGDRILILEDTNGDGVMDTSKVYYQGNDIDSAMGICILGKDVIVSASPYIWKFTDEDGDDVPDKKVAMFTETGQPQHDHSNHSFLFGPDGKLYWNFGNSGGQVKDANGKIVVDIHGREVVDNGKPFFGGMPFRCNLDGSEFEVLAHNFRNNWETTVDSFGTLWQSDNDDDGNRGTRINFVMEHGNYGFRDEMTGAAWQAERINMESEIPLRHWHLNDPGVVPNVLQTGAGSPSGICLYEGTLLPARFQNQMIHCDPGPNIVRAYPVTPSGAGYTATIEPIATGVRDKWFRPADVCTAPDGSLYVTDWYDPGVGGHRQEDVDRGRLFRIAPPGVGYKIPKFDYSTADGAIVALQNPALAVRYKAWMALHEMGAKAEPALLRLYESDNSRMRARALWLLGKIGGRGDAYVRKALADKDADIRITGIRLMRQLNLPASTYLPVVIDDTSPAVRREALVALRYDDSPAMPAMWAQLASHYDGDRWYLEALGVASDLRADECYVAMLKSDSCKKMTTKNPSLRNDLAWRVRAKGAADEVASLIANTETTLADTDRYFRSLEFHPAEVRSKSLAAKVLKPEALAKMRASNGDKSDAVIVRSLERMQIADVPTDENLNAGVARYIASRVGTPEYLKLVQRFNPKGVEASLLDFAMHSEDDSASVEAIGMLASMSGGLARVTDALHSEGDDSMRMVKVLGLLGTEPAVEMLGGIVTDETRPYEIRFEAVRGLSKSNLGAKSLISLAMATKLPADSRLLAGGLLSANTDESIRRDAEKCLPLPSLSDAKPLPPVDQLAKMEGDVARGESLFRGVATCGNCHLVGGVGKQVGPDLSEIGTKLSREAIYTSILDPSAGISHNYENYVVLLESGQVVAGVKVSESDGKLTIRTAEAIDRTFADDEIVEVKQSDKSIMPENLHHTVDQQGLIDIVQYMTTLVKK